MSQLPLFEAQWPYCQGIGPTNHGAAVRRCYLIEGIPMIMELSHGWAAKQQLPALPKYLLETMVDAAGMNRTQIIRHEAILERCGMTPNQIDRSISLLARRGFISIEKWLDGAGGVIRLNYPVQDWENDR